MTTPSIGVAVIGAGMAGRAHASGYRSAPTVLGAGLPDVRLMAIADAYGPFATDTARRYGYERGRDELAGPEHRDPRPPRPLGVAVGHAGGVPVSDTREPVENEDVATFTATFAGGAAGTIAVSRIAYQMANALGFEVFCRRGAAMFDLARTSCTRTTSSTTRVPWSGWPPRSAPPTWAPRWTPATCSGRASTRWRRSGTWVTWCTTPPPRTPGSTSGTAASTACWTTASPGSRRARTRWAWAGRTP
jgi:predicted dehydrogenase